jgi:hypothetical protein
MGSWRDATLKELKAELWRYLSSAAHPEMIAATAEGIWGLQRGEVKRLVATHQLLSESTCSMLDTVEWLLPRMPANTRLVDQELVGMIRGPVDWTRTRQLQAASGDRTRFICMPPDRHYDQPLSRLIAFVLRGCRGLIEVASLHGARGPVAMRLEEIELQSRRLQQNVKLRGVPAVLPSMSQLASLDRRYHIEGVISFARAYVDTFERLEPTLVRQVVEEHLLAPANDATLFELLTGCRIVRELERLGLVVVGASLIEPGAGSPLARLQHGSDEVQVWWQRGTLRFVNLDEGLYAQALKDSGFNAPALRPDFILKFRPSGRVVLVEVKYTESEDSPVHSGVKDVLLYLMDARSFFDNQPLPHALVVAKGAGNGRAEGRVLISGAERAQLAPQVSEIMAAHGTSYIAAGRAADLTSTNSR